MKGARIKKSAYLFVLAYYYIETDNTTKIINLKIFSKSIYKTEVLYYNGINYIV